MSAYLFKPIIEHALFEDLGMGDLTTNAIFSNSDEAKGQFISKSSGVLAGLEVLEEVYSYLKGDVQIKYLKNDGDTTSKGEIIADVKGPVTSLLSGERVILNILQHMSGIATATHDLVTLLDDPSIDIVDTRKTLPGLRGLQKYAVTCGGGKNHRFRLDDGVMIKDNHIKAAGGITKAIELVKKCVGHMVSIEVETETKEQVLEAVKAGADIIMLDNMTPHQIKDLVDLVPDTIITEVSGGVNPTNISTFRGCGADILSVGWITHSVKALDISFNLYI